jgi:hypothetical protein
MSGIEGDPLLEVAGTGSSYVFRAEKSVAAADALIKHWEKVKPGVVYRDFKYSHSAILHDALNALQGRTLEIQGFTTADIIGSSTVFPEELHGPLILECRYLALTSMTRPSKWPDITTETDSSARLKVVGRNIAKWDMPIRTGPDGKIVVKAGRGGYFTRVPVLFIGRTALDKEPVHNLLVCGTRSAPNFATHLTSIEGAELAAGNIEPAGGRTDANTRTWYARSRRTLRDLVLAYNEIRSELVTSPLDVADVYAKYLALKDLVYRDAFGTKKGFKAPAGLLQVIRFLSPHKTESESVLERFRVLEEFYQTLNSDFARLICTATMLFTIELSKSLEKKSL